MSKKYRKYKWFERNYPESNSRIRQIINNCIIRNKLTIGELENACREIRKVSDPNSLPDLYKHAEAIGKMSNEGLNGSQAGAMLREALIEKIAEDKRKEQIDMDAILKAEKAD